MELNQDLQTEKDDEKGFDDEAFDSEENNDMIQDNSGVEDKEGENSDTRTVDTRDDLNKEMGDDVMEDADTVQGEVISKSVSEEDADVDVNRIEDKHADVAISDGDYEVEQSGDDPDSVSSESADANEIKSGDARVDDVYMNSNQDGGTSEANLNDGRKTEFTELARGTVVEEVPVASVASVTTVMPASEKSKKRGGGGMVFGMVLMVIAVLCGVGFGVWTMMDAETQKKELNSQISSLKQENAKLQEEMSGVSESEDDTVNIEANSSYKNPIVVSDVSGVSYSIPFSSLPVSNSSGDGSKNLTINLRDGQIDSCLIGYTNNLEGGVGSACNISGLSGKIYKVVGFGAGHDAGLSQIGFIMEDGTVSYLSLLDAIDKSDYAIDGVLKFDKPVVDILTIQVSEGNYGYGSAVIVFNDGSFVKYDESMLND